MLESSRQAENASRSINSRRDLQRDPTLSCSEDLLRPALLRDTSVRLLASLDQPLDPELDPRVESSRRQEVEESLEVSRYKVEIIEASIENTQTIVLPVRYTVVFLPQFILRTNRISCELSVTEIAVFLYCLIRLTEFMYPIPR